MLSGHTDVVPVDGQVWSSDAFTCVAREGRLYGRGTADMKGFIATALALVPELQALRLAAPVHLALTYDEEVGCKGVPGLLDHLADRLPAPPARLRGRRADRHARRQRPQGQGGLRVQRDRPGQPLRAQSSGRERDRDRRRDHRRAAPPERRVPGGGSVRGRLRAAPLHGQHRASSPAAARSTSCPTTAASSSSSGTLPGQDPDALFARIRDWAEPHAAAVDARASPAAGIAWQELMSYPALGGTARAGIEEVCCQPDRDPGADQARVRDRGRTLRRARDPDRGVRPRRHQGRAQARRVRRAGSARALRPVPAPAGARDGGGLIRWPAPPSKSPRRIWACTAAATAAFPT